MEDSLAKLEGLVAMVVAARHNGVTVAQLRIQFVVQGEMDMEEFELMMEVVDQRIQAYTKEPVKLGQMVDVYV